MNQPFKKTGNSVDHSMIYTYRDFPMATVLKYTDYAEVSWLQVCSLLLNYFHQLFTSHRHKLFYSCQEYLLLSHF